MKKMLFACFCLAAWSLPAQEVKLTSSAEMDMKVAGTYYDRALGSDASGNYILRVSGPITDQQTIVEQYSPEMKWMGSISIAGGTGVMGDTKFHRQTLLLNGKILTFHDHFTKALGSTTLSIIPYEMSGKTLPEVVLDKEATANGLKTPTWDVSLSPDRSKLMVLDEIPFEKGTNEKMRLKVFSTANWEQLWTRDMQLATEGERYPDNDITVGDDGTAYVFKHVKLGSKEHLYQLIIATKEAVKTEKVDLQTFYPTGFRMVFDADGALLIGGNLATHGGHIGNWERVWALKATASGIAFNKVTAINPAILKSHLGENRAAAANGKLADMTLRAVLPRKSGGFILLAEEFKSSKTAVGSATPPVYEHTLDYGGIAIVAIDGTGKEIWTNYIRKKQQIKTMDEEKSFGSFASHSIDDKLYLVWNYTSWETVIGVPFRFWLDQSGAKIDIDNLYSRKAVQPTLLTVLNPDGAFAYADRTFASYPLADIQKTNAFEMAMDPSINFPQANGLIVMSRMAGVSVKKYKFSTIKF